MTNNPNQYETKKNEYNKIIIGSIVILIITGLFAITITILNDTNDDEEFFKWYSEKLTEDKYYEKISYYIRNEEWQYAIKFSDSGSEYKISLISEIDQFDLSHDYDLLRDEYKNYLEASCDGFIYTSLFLEYYILNEPIMYEAYRNLARSSFNESITYLDKCSDIESLIIHKEL